MPIQTSQDLFEKAPGAAPATPPAGPASDDELLARLQLATARGAGPILLQRAVLALGSALAVTGSSVSRLAQVEGFGQNRAEALLKNVDPAAATRELARARHQHIRILCAADHDWPPGLRTILDPPIVLYMRGELQPIDRLAVGIVGSRQCTMYGREQSQRFAGLLATARLTVISGGARGIDTAAHEGALRAAGRTVVVQGCGLEHCYPTENADLYAKIADGRGAVLSELPLNAAPLPTNFPPRNRIIAGLSLGVLVVEASPRSGSLITARLAGEDYGREVFALPGRVDSTASAGTHDLIKKGAAALVDRLEDILDGLAGPLSSVQIELRENHARLAADAILTCGQTTATTASMSREAQPARNAAAQPEDVAVAAAALAPAAARQGAPVPRRPSKASAPPGAPSRFTPAQQKILDAMTGRESTVDDLCQTTAFSPAVVLTELTFLQLTGAVQRIGGQRFHRRR